MNNDSLLTVCALKTFFYTEAGVVKAVDGIDFDVRKGETVGLVGESGSGKTVTALSVLRIVPQPGRIVSGQIYFEGEDLLMKSEHEMDRYRGSRLAIVFQDPTSSLNPVLSIENQLMEIITYHQKISKEKAKEKILNLFEKVRIPDPQTRLKQYPHQFSGGMKQRLCIARALACEPSLLFADEPTSNLDVTVQAQILHLMKDLKKSLGMSLVMITHDMGIVADMTDRTVVMYAGRVFEAADTRIIFKRFKHPYTEALLNAVPSIDRKGLKVIPGNIPNLITPPTGCRFHPRCAYATSRCSQEVPQLEEVEPDHFVACHRSRELDLTGEMTSAKHFRSAEPN